MVVSFGYESTRVGLECRRVSDVDSEAERAKGEHSGAECLGAFAISI